MKPQFRGLWVTCWLLAALVLVAGTAHATSVFYYRTTFGDGAWHPVGGTWTYQYRSSTQAGLWKDGAYLRLAYNYGTGQWFHYRNTTGATLGGLSGPTEFIGDGNWYALASGWSYKYAATCDTGYWKDQGVSRFAYGYGAGQWYHVRRTWTKLGATGISPYFIGTTTYVNIGNGWYYRYASGCDTGYWKDASNHQFGYSYRWGEWWDYIGSIWGRLGLTASSEQFIADGQNRQFSTSDYFRYAGSYYYWRTGSVDYYRYGYATGTWEAYQTSGSWVQIDSSGSEVDVRYIGDHKYVARGRYADSGTDAPAGYYNIYYKVWLAGVTSHSWTSLTTWTIHRPGADNKWSGGRLNVMWCHSPDHNYGVSEWTIEDTIVFKYDMTAIGLSSMIDWLSYVRDYFRANISTVGFSAHGNSTGWQIGEWIDTSNYASHQADFQRWGTYMTADGQIVSYHCSSGYATTMLNQIATWTGCEIYAHQHTVYVYSYKVDTSAPDDDSSVWNHNRRDFRFRKTSTYTDDPDPFEYMSNPSIAVRAIIEERAW